MASSVRNVVWKDTTIAAAADGFTVLLDNRPIRTPARDPFVVPTRALAEAVAEEWRAQDKQIDPQTMPLTRLSNSAIDKIPVQFDETVAALAAYAQTDMTCFRADAPERLVARQAKMWDPPLNWLRETHGIALIQTVGVVAVDQPGKSLDAMHHWLASVDAFTLMGLHDLIGISGSIVLARAVHEGQIKPEAAWEAAILDEMWNVEAWGEDAEAAAAREAKRREFMAAHAFLRLLGA